MEDIEIDDDIGDIDGKDAFISEVARRARFTKKDIRLILNIIVEILTEAARNNRNVVVRGLGELYTQTLPERKSSKLFGETRLREAKRVAFRLSRNIRDAWKRDAA